MRIAFLLVALSVTSILSAQRVARHTTDAGNAYPDISLNNLVGMYDMTLGDWERNMKLISKTRDDFGADGITYTINPKDGTNDGICFATKKDDAVEIIYTPGSNAVSIFGDFMKEMKEFYVQDVDGYQIYSWTSFTKVKYIFAVKVAADQEYVRVYVSK